MKNASIALAAAAALGGMLISALPSKAFGFYSSNTIGNTTFINGYNDRGSYSGSISTYGNTTTYSGYNSSGNFVGGSCTKIGSYVSCYGY